MAVGCLPGVASHLVLLDCQVGKYGLEGRRCVSSLAPSAASSSVSNFPLSCSKAPILASPSGRSFSCYFSGRRSSWTRSNGLECATEYYVRWNSERRVSSKLPATKDSSREVFLRTDSPDGAQDDSYRRLGTQTSSDAEEQAEIVREDLNTDGSGTENTAERQRVLEFDSDSSTSEGVTLSNEGEGQDNGLQNTAVLGTVAASLGFIFALVGFGTASYVFKDQINEFLGQLSEFIEGYGPAGYGIFVLVYAGLELLAIPAIPLTMSAGLLFGVLEGTIIVSLAGTIAATGAFLIARYLARNRLLELTKNNKKFLAIDRAIGDDGFRVVTLLRLSPLLPFSLGNYLYGLTSVKLVPYVLGSWLGMLPGSWAYVSAGAIGRTYITKQESEAFFTGGPDQLWTIGLGIAVTVFAGSYVTRVAKDALKGIDD